MQEEIRKEMEAARPDFDNIPEFLKDDEWFGEEVEPFRLDFTKPYEPPRYILSWDDIGFAPIGGVQAISGQSGNGKTMMIAQFIAAILGGEYGQLRYELTDTPEPRVLYIDTEMEESNTIAMKNRVLSMTDRIIGEKYDDFVVLMLREAVGKDKQTSAAVTRWRKILKAIWEYKPTVAFIDGLLDVVSDFNDNAVCQDIIYKCMQTATHYGISLWCVVHQNPGTEKLVGHIGSMLERKVTDIFVTKKERDSQTDEVTFKVHQMKARGRDVPDWQFKVQPVNGWGMPEQINTISFANADNIDQIKRWLQLGREDIEWPATKVKIKTILKNRGGVTNHSALQADIEAAKNRGFLKPVPKVKGQNYERFILNPDVFGNSQDDPFGQPSEDSPF